MRKNVSIRLKPQGAFDAFVEAGEEPRASELRETKSATPKAEKGEMVRITLDLPKSLHRKLKIHVAGNGITIADYLRAMLDEHL